VLTAIESANGARGMRGRSERVGMRVRIQGRDRHGVAGDSIRWAVEGGAGCWRLLGDRVPGKRRCASASCSGPGKPSWEKARSHGVATDAR